MKEILITGVSGFIGKHLYHYLSNEHLVTGISRTAMQLERCFTVDLSDKEAVAEFFKGRRFDVVIHLAAITANKNNLADPLLLLNNLQLSANLAGALKQNPTGHLINFSSSSVYDNYSGHCNEKSPTDPSNNADGLYGLAKLSSETLFNLLLKNTAITHLRVPMVYGKGMDDSRMHTTFSKELKETNTITVFGGGQRIISHINVDDLAEKVFGVIKGKITGLFNVSGESVSTFELAQNIIKEQGNSGSSIKTVEEGSKATLIVDGSKLNALLKNQQHAS